MNIEKNIKNTSIVITDLKPINTKELYLRFLNYSFNNDLELCFKSLEQTINNFDIRNNKNFDIKKRFLLSVTIYTSLDISNDLINNFLNLFVYTFEKNLKDLQSERQSILNGYKNIDTKYFIIQFFNSEKVINLLDNTNFQIFLFNGLNKDPIGTLKFITNNLFDDKDKEINLFNIDLKELVNQVNDYIGLN